MEPKITLGLVVRDTVTGFTGTVIGRADYLHGESSLQVQPPLDKEGAWVKNLWFEEERLEAWHPEDSS